MGKVWPGSISPGIIRDVDPGASSAEAGAPTFGVLVEDAVVGAGIRVGAPEIGPAGAQRGQIDVIQFYLLPRLGSQRVDVPARDKTFTSASNTRLRARRGDPAVPRVLLIPLPFILDLLRSPLLQFKLGQGFTGSLSQGGLLPVGRLLHPPLFRPALLLRLALNPAGARRLREGAPSSLPPFPAGPHFPERAALLASPSQARCLGSWIPRQKGPAAPLPPNFVRSRGSSAPTLKLSLRLPGRGAQQGRGKVLGRAEKHQGCHASSKRGIFNRISLLFPPISLAPTRPSGPSRASRAA